MLENPVLQHRIGPYFQVVEDKQNGLKPRNIGHNQSISGTSTRTYMYLPSIHPLSIAESHDYLHTFSIGTSGNTQNKSHQERTVNLPPPEIRSYDQGLLTIGFPQ